MIETEPIICTVCGEPINHKYFCVQQAGIFRQSATEFYLSIGCVHVEPVTLPDRPVLGIAGSAECLGHLMWKLVKGETNGQST